MFLKYELEINISHPKLFIFKQLDLYSSGERLGLRTLNYNSSRMRGLCKFKQFKTINLKNNPNHNGSMQELMKKRELNAKLLKEREKIT